MSLWFVLSHSIQGIKILSKQEFIIPLTSDSKSTQFLTNYSTNDAYAETITTTF